MSLEMSSVSFLWAFLGVTPPLLHKKNTILRQRPTISARRPCLPAWHWHTQQESTTDPAGSPVVTMVSILSHGHSWQPDDLEVPHFRKPPILETGLCWNLHEIPGKIVDVEQSVQRVPILKPTKDVTIFDTWNRPILWRHSCQAVDHFPHKAKDPPARIPKLAKREWEWRFVKR
jgi:hypothetical protein